MDIPMGRFPPPLAPNLRPGLVPSRMMSPGSPTMNQQPTNIWVETKAADGKSYFYHSETRETVWNKPEGATIFTQDQFAAHIARQRMAAPGGMGQPGHGPPGLLGQRPMMLGGIPPVGREFFGFTARQLTSFNPVVPGFNPAFPPGNRFPIMSNQNHHQQHVQHHQQPWPVPHQQVPANTSLLGNYPLPSNSNLAPDHGHKTNSILDPFIDPEIKKRASEWIEYKTPEGKPYYFNTISKQSVWEKPKPLLDMDDALEKAKIQLAARTNLNQVTNDFNNRVQEVRPEVITLDTSKSTNGHGNSSSVKLIESKVAEQPKDKSKPVSSTPVDKTPWCVVWTGDGKVFFYNPSTKSSVWERPPELMGRPDVDKLLKGPPKEDPEPTIDLTDDNVIEKKRSAETEPEPLSKKLKKLEEEKKEVAATPEVIAARKREEVPIEERIKEFKGMLSEKKVSAFSTWEKELHKIVFDERYLLLTSKERKAVFDDYVCEVAEQEREEKRKLYKTHREQYRKLLEDGNLDVRSSFSDFARKWSKDERFINIEKMREKEGLFNDYINELKRREKEERAKERDKLKSDFNQLLKDNESELSKFVRRFKWSEVREVLKHDPRYRGIESSSEKEDIVRNYVGQLRQDNEEDAVKEEGEESETDEEEKVSKEKQERIEASLKNRKQEVEKEMSKHLNERAKEREQHQRLEAVETMNALLSDHVKSPDMTWKDGKKVLFKDKRIELCSTLSRDEMEVLFQQHIEKLYKKKVDKFHSLLNEHKVTLTSSWRDVRRSIKDDSRFLKFSSSDRKCEREFKEYLRMKLDQAKSDLKQFLTECKILTYKSAKLIEESDLHLQEIISVLQNDQRYLNLEQFEDDRREILMAYVEELEKKGPPPPPTASVRKKTATAGHE